MGEADSSPWFASVIWGGEDEGRVAEEGGGGGGGGGEEDDKELPKTPSSACSGASEELMRLYEVIGYSVW